MVYSSGGTKYIVPVSIKILKIFPLEEGLIIQCEYDPNNIRFSLSTLNSEEHSFAYLTLNSHPLNDLHPLAIMSPAQPLQDLVCTKVCAFSDMNLCIVRAHLRQHGPTLCCRLRFPRQRACGRPFTCQPREGRVPRQSRPCPQTSSSSSSCLYASSYP